MNNDNNDDRDNDATGQATPSNLERDSVRKEPSFSLFDSDTELEVDDIEAEDFASDYAAEGYDDEPFGDDGYTDEAGLSDADDEATPAQDPVGGLWADDTTPELDEQPAEQSERTPWDEEPETTVTEPITPEEELPLEYTEADSEDERWEDEIDDDDGNDDYDYDDNEYAEEPQKLPIGLIIVALVALALLAAGGYGVIKERAAAEAELTELRARLATAVEQQDIQAERDRARGLESENARMLAQVDALTSENTTLSEQVDTLKQQLEKGNAAVTATSVAAETRPQPVRPSTPSSSSTASPTPTPTNTATSGGADGWFVNFGSYSQRAKAQEWAERLKPDSGTVIVAAADSSGTSVYRVRIIGLESKADAQRIAAQLERAHGLSKLWVGQQ